MSFQQSVNLNPPLGVVGSFASTGVNHSVLAGAMQFVAGTSGVTIAAFAWANTLTGETQNAKPAAPTNWSQGFVSRDSNIAVITNWQGQSSMLIPSGLEVTLHDRGDFWAVSKTAAVVGQKVFASDTDGTLSTGAAGATVSGHTETNYTVATSAAIGANFKITAQ